MIDLKKLFARLATVALVLGAYFYFATGGAMSLKGRAIGGGNEFYTLQAQGFWNGHLYMNMEPDPRILVAPNPYDPSTNGPYRLDEVYYGGHYYLYQGPLPCIAFILPFRLLAGDYPTPILTLLFFGSLSFLFLYALLLNVKDDHFAGSSELWAVLGGLSIGLGNVTLFHMTYPLFYFICILSSGAPMAAGALFLYRSLREEEPAPTWLGLAAACFALSVAGRASMVLGDILFVAVMTLWLRRQSASALPPQDKAGLLKALWIPTLVIGALLALYNFERFDNPFQFGMKYQVTSLDLTQGGFIGEHVLSNTWLNLKAVLLQRFRWQPHFPWVLALTRPEIDANWDYYHTEANVGFIAMWPAIWLLLLLPAGLKAWSQGRQSAGRTTGRLSFFLALTTGMALLQLALILSLSGSTFRYTGDFSAPLLFVTAVLVLLLLDLELSVRWRVGLGAFYLAASLFGVVVCLLFALGGFFGNFWQTYLAPPPEALKALASHFLGL